MRFKIVLGKSYFESCIELLKMFYFLTRLNLRSASSKPAMHHCSRISPGRRNIRGVHPQEKLSHKNERKIHRKTYLINLIYNL